MTNRVTAGRPDDAVARVLTGRCGQRTEAAVAVRVAQPDLTSFRADAGGVSVPGGRTFDGGSPGGPAADAAIDE
ncbi:hypothetical protein OG244_36105 [Streptomyces brevispora]|uniref:hypothetical protein n=1 Tax=Streptomyces brevispora TaxID=887462 RepID=UPI002E31EAEC|nr:hypothetical protein [Streptomyces brevispora]